MCALRTTAFTAMALLVAHSEAATLSTTFGSNNGQSGNMFDILTNSQEITLNQIGLNIPAGVSNGTYRVYFKLGTHVGSENNSAAWTLLDTFTGVSSAGNNTPTFVDITDVVVPANTRISLYPTITTPNFLGLRYTNGTGVGNTASANADLTIFEGTGNSFAFGRNFRPRVWNGTLDYTVTPAAVPEPARAGLALLGILTAGTIRRRKK